MIRGTLVILGLCFVTGSHQISYHQALTLSNITNITQLFEMAHIRRNGIRVNLYEALPYFGFSGEQTYVGPGYPNIAMPDECSPRLTTVEIPRSGDDDANVMYWPKCTRIHRCGGCCANNMIRCVPDIVERQSFTVLKVKLWDSDGGDVNMDWEGAVPKSLDVHVKCKLECSITASDCNEHQQFEAFDCLCRCRSTWSCGPLQRFDLETCTCVCKDANPICEEGSTFNYATCSCQITRTDQRYSNLQIDSEEVVEEAEPETTTTTTVATTLATAPCPAFCPPSFHAAINELGNCVCVPPHTFGGY